MVLRDIDFLLIPDGGGVVEDERLKTAEKFLRRRLVNDVMILNGGDSEEDVLYLGKKLKPGMHIAIVTFPLHFQEYLEIIKRAQDYGDFPMGVSFENIKTSQDVGLSVYGTIGLLEEELRGGKVKYKRNRREKFLNFLKEKFHQFFPLS